MFFHRKQEKPDPAFAGQEPVLLTSICTSETTAGFRDESGHFTGIMLIRDANDLESFRHTYGIQGEIRRIY